MIVSNPQPATRNMSAINKLTTDNRQQATLQFFNKQQELQSKIISSITLKNILHL